MKTYKEYKNYYRNASKDEILEDTYQDYVSLDIANKKLEQIKNHVQTQQSIIKSQPSADRPMVSKV